MKVRTNSHRLRAPWSSAKPTSPLQPPQTCAVVYISDGDPLFACSKISRARVKFPFLKLGGSAMKSDKALDKALISSDKGLIRV